jgi:ABC-type multidrug transport system permease subunit
MRGLKQIALTGRAVCATIHQPSIAIFHSFDALLLLKRGGETVFFGDLGVESMHLINYLEQYEDTPKIQPGENPATWMLTAIGAGSASSNKKPFDYAGNYQVSDLHKDCYQRIAKVCESVSEDGIVSFPSQYATSRMFQLKECTLRARLIYWRSPSYNLIRVMTSVVIALLFGSVYVSSRTPEDEADMNSRATTIFIAFLFLAVNALNTVLGVFEKERNMFYRHNASLMYNRNAVLWAFTLAEIPFILLSSMLFVVIFYFMVGFAVDAAKFFLFYLFFTLNMACFTFIGQMLMALNRDSVTAQGFGGLVISLTSLFTGVLIRPSNIPNFYIFLYWMMPGHYVFEGLLVSQYRNDNTPIIASPGSAFWEFLDCDDKIAAGATECVGTAEQWVFASFGGEFVEDNIPWNILYLVGLAITTRVITAIALKRLNYRST